VVAQVLPDFGLLKKTRSTFLEGYGVVFSVDAELERPANPFFTPGSKTEVKQNMARRKKELIEKLSFLLKEKFADMKSVGDSGSISVIVYLFNSNPAYVPDLPGQIVFTAKKQETGIDVAIREF